MKEGMLISFEGGEACGKSTQIKKFIEFLENNHIDYLATKEPGGTEIGESIRQILLHSKEDLTPETEFLLFSASRAKLINDVVKPALKEGKVVVLDRYFDSSYAYQGYAGGMNLDTLKKITEFAIQEQIPDITYLLDITYEDGMSRKSKDENLKNLDRIESKGKEYHDKVRNGYLQLAKNDKKRFVIIDATQSINSIYKTIIETFEERYKKKIGK